jgi:hypothetical protein
MRRRAWKANVSPMRTPKSPQSANENQLPIPTPRAVIAARRRMTTLALAIFLATLGVACALVFIGKFMRPEAKTKPQPSLRPDGR